MTSLAVFDELPLLEEVPECHAWSVNPYRRCDIRCRYCITGAQGRSVPRYGPDEVVDRLGREIRRAERRGPISAFGLGGLCDAYPRAEAEHGVTRLVLQELFAQHRKVAIISKGATLHRDLDLIARYDRVNVTISLCSVDEEALAALDPGAPTAAERLALVAALACAGAKVSLSVAPWIPGVTDVGRLAASVPDGVPVRVAPLNVTSPAMAGSQWAQRWDQAEIDAAYLAAHRRAGALADVFWAHPVDRPGGTAAQMHNMDGTRFLGSHSLS